MECKLYKLKYTHILGLFVDMLIKCRYMPGNALGCWPLKRFTVNYFRFFTISGLSPHLARAIA